MADKESFARMAPHWLDDVVKPVANSKDPHRIGDAIARCKQIQDAIKRGIAEAQPGKPGGDLDQAISGAVQRVIASSDGRVDEQRE